MCKPPQDVFAVRCEDGEAVWTGLQAPNVHWLVVHVPSVFGKVFG